METEISHQTTGSKHTTSLSLRNFLAMHFDTG